MAGSPVEVGHRPDGAVIPSPRVIALSDGADNALGGQWPDRVFTAVTRAELHAFEVPEPRGCALICGGGGYLQLVYDREGTDIAAWLNGLGYNAYVLVHRLPGADDGQGGTNPSDIALTDAMTALSHIERDVPLVLVGLSSGGHLAGTIGCQPGVDAKGVIIAYAPINANHSNYKAPAGKPDYPPVEKQAFYDAWPIGISAEPHGVPQCPVFLAYALHDQAVPIEHALNLIKTVRDAGGHVDAHIFATAPHGFALRDREGTHKAWKGLAEAWLDGEKAGNG
jgi:dienelactone hydrolase